MNTNNLNTALYEKMATEQEKYRDWLKSQPPEEILHHTYEYTVREDIVMAMEELELTDAQTQALLESPSPLADVYRYFEKLETGYMDVIRDSIENRADDVCRAKEELRTTPVYPHSAAYAREHGEMAQYNLSYQANSACKEAIEQTISAHYAENRLDTEAAVKDVLEKFGTERVQFILANTIQRKNYDGRISQDNKAWAKNIPTLDGVGKNKLYPFRPELFQHVFDRRLRIQPVLCIVGADSLFNGFFASAVCLIRTVILCHLSMLGRIGGRLVVERGSS